ncbi:PhaM family polyhydroxyalkanoate granule multifunctional regulatory protein [Rhodocyclaceae bacterium SMB388]
MSKDNSAQDPLDFVRSMWNNMGFPLPGMVAPTLDLDELDKRIQDLKAVEHWLKMNLNMLQMTTQGLEMQRAAVAAVKAMSEHAAEQTTEAPKADEQSPFASAAMWPWNFMNAQTPAAKSDEDTAAGAQANGDAKAEGKPRPRAPSRKTNADQK